MALHRQLLADQAAIELDDALCGRYRLVREPLCRAVQEQPIETVGTDPLATLSRGQPNHTLDRA